MDERPSEPWVPKTFSVWITKKQTTEAYCSLARAQRVGLMADQAGLRFVPGRFQVSSSDQKGNRPEPTETVRRYHCA
jgi:hypothetical protein